MTSSRTIFGKFGFLSLAALFLLSAPAGAAEQTKEFLDALRDRGNGYFDMAIEYLDRMKNSPLASDEFKQTVEFERGVTYWAHGAVTSDPRRREELFADSEKAFATFSSANPKHKNTITAHRYLASIHTIRGRYVAGLANRLGIDEAEKKKRLAEAVAHFQKADETLSSSEKSTEALLKAFPAQIPPKEKEKIAERERLKSELSAVRIGIADVRYEKAAVLPRKSKPWEEAIQQAADAYSGIIDEYQKLGSSAIVYKARVGKGRCEFELGKHADALLTIDECLTGLAYASVPYEQLALVREIKNNAMTIALQCWPADKKDDKALREGLQRAAMWDADVAADSSRDSNPEGAWLEFRFHLGKALYDYYPQVKGNREKRTILHVGEILPAIRKYLMPVVMHANPHQSEAREILAKIGVGIDKDEPKTFAEAMQRAGIARGQMTGAWDIIRLLEEKKLEKEEEEKNLEKELEDAKKMEASARQDARKYYELALRLADTLSPAKQLDEACYYLCRINHYEEQYYEAAVFGEHVARRHPQGTYGKPSAIFALYSWLEIYKESLAKPNPDVAFESARIRELAQLVRGTFGEPARADAAFMYLAEVAATHGRADEALDYVAAISPENPGLARVYFRIGDALWRQYTLAKWDDSKLPQAQRAAPETFTAQLTKIEEVLQHGLAHWRKHGGGNVSPIIANGALFLSKVYLEQGESKKALALLEDKQIGPLTLLAKKDPAVAKTAFGSSTYRAALRANIGILDSEPERINNALDAMKELEARMKSEPAKLIAIYRLESASLKAQIDATDDAAKKRALAKGFGKFLEKIRGVDSYPTLIWVFTSYRQLAKVFESDSGSVSPEGIAYYDGAVKTADRILKLSEEEALGSPPESKGSMLAVRIAKAECLARQRKFEEAEQIMLELLTERNMLISLQVAAADMYMEWGAVDPEKYKTAILGSGTWDGKKRRYTIWGYRVISTILQRYKESDDPNEQSFRNTFFDARLKIVAAWREYAASQRGSDRDKYVRLAQQAYDNTKRMASDFGGPAMAKRFEDELAKLP